MNALPVDELIKIAARKLRRGANDEAAAVLSTALELHPDNPTASLLLGECHLREGRSSAAIGAFRRGLSLAPEDHELTNALSRAFAEAGRFDEAASALGQVAKSLSGRPDFMHAYALALRRAGRFEDALPVLDAAIELDPDAPDPRFTRATTNLTLGRFEAGWQDFDARRAMSNAQTMPGLPVWDGSPAPDARLVVMAEGGHGDIIWASRFLAAVRPLVGSLDLVVPKSLANLLANVEGADRVHISTTETAFDLHCPILSLPVRLGLTDPDAHPPARLTPMGSSDRIAPLIARAQARRRVGIIWSGNEGYSQNRERSAPLEAFLPLVERPEIQLFSLQKGPGQAALRESRLGDLIIDCDDFDFAETAALIEQLDLIIMTDTAVCHIAGSLGKAVWLLLDTAPFWIWGLSGPSTPWYPSMRLFRQTQARDWAHVMGQVVTALDEP